MTEPIPERVAERAATRYVEIESGCYVSTYSVAGAGYAQIGWTSSTTGKTNMTGAHRAAWVYHKGCQPRQTIDHLCHERRCVNPAHLRDISNEQNGRRNRPGFDYPLDQTCHRNHGVPRNKWGRCPECVKIARDRWKERHPDRYRAAQDRYNRKIRERQ